MGTRRTFKCKFNDRVTSENRDGVVQSLISQFQGLDADPEVTIDGNTFTLTLTISDEVTPTMVRDKLVWNYFIDQVTVGDSIRKIKVMRMPKATQEVIGNGEGQLDGIARDTGVNEILVNDDGHQQKQMEYKIDMGDRPDGPPVKHRSVPGALSVTSSWVKQADPGSLRNEGQSFTHEPDDVMGPEDLDSMATDVTKLPKVFASEDDAGGSQFGQPYDKKTVMDSVDNAPQATRAPRVTVFNSGTGPTEETGGPIPFNSWLSETEATMPKGEDTKAPLDFTASLKGEKGDSENIDSAIELPEATQGGTVLGLEGWFSASLHFGYDDGDSDNDNTYDYSEDDDDDNEDEV